MAGDCQNVVLVMVVRDWVGRAVIVAALLAGAVGATEHPERWYQEKAAKELKGKMEVVVPDGRVDIVTASHAIEVEFAANWKEAIGQSLWYAMQTNKAAGIVIVLEDPVKDAPDAIRLESVIKAHKLPIKVWWCSPDAKAMEDRKARAGVAGMGSGASVPLR